MITASPLVVAILGAMTVLTISLGILTPGYLRRRELAQRLAGAVGSVTVASDLGGRSRRAGALRLARPTSNRLLQLVETRLERASFDITPSELLTATAIIALTAAVLGYALFASIVVAVVAAIGAAALPFVWLRMRERGLQRAFRAQLPDNIGLLAASVRAGHSLLQGLEQVAKEAAEPSSGAFMQAVREIGMGAAQEEALERLAARYPSEDLELVVTATNVQHQVGGSLARVLDEIVVTLRERVRIEGDINALTAQQRYSAYVLALLPVFVAAALFFISNDYISQLFEGMLRFVALAAGVMIVVGFITMQRIATIDV